nr:PepSY domain-containing protein [uncultured Gellertiella sp.]
MAIAQGVLLAGAVVTMVPGVNAAPNHRPQVHTPPSADDHSRQSFADLVRSLVAAGEVQPLHEVLEIARKASPGEIVSIKLRHQKNHWVYHVRILKKEGRRTELSIDGKSLKIVERR